MRNKEVNLTMEEQTHAYDPYESNHDHLADVYDEQIRNHLGHYIRENYFEILDRVTEMMTGPSQGRRVLDIGIGTGLLSERLPSELDTHGIDTSVKMMDRLRDKGLNVSLRKGHFLNIPHRDSMFDCVVSTFALHHVPAALQIPAYSEMVRVLKPVGQILIADFMTENERQRGDLIERFKREDRKDMLMELEDEHFTDISSIKSHLEATGFRVTYERGSVLSWILCANRG